MTTQITSNYFSENPNPVDLNKRLNEGNAMVIMALCREYGAGFNEVNIATAWHSIAVSFKETGKKQVEAFKRDNYEVLQQLANMTKEYVGYYSDQNYATLFWSLGALNYKDESLVNWLVENVVCSSMSSQELSMTAWGAHKLGVKDNDFWAAVAYVSGNIIDQFNSQGLANFAASFPCDGLNQNIISMIAQEAILKINTFNSQELMNLAVALVKRKAMPKELLREIDKRAVELIDDQFKPVGITGLTYAFAQIGVLMPFVARAKEKVKSNGSDFSIQEHICMANSLRRLQVLDRSIVADIRFRLSTEEHELKELDHLQLQKLGIA